MATENITIQFNTEGIPQTRREIDQLQSNTIASFTELNSAFELFKTALGGVQTVATKLYSALVDSNEKLNAELLKSQTNLASNLEIWKDSEQITDITERITATQEVLRESLKQIEKDTVDLVGVTTDQVNGVFQVLLQNSQKFIGQSKEFKDPIEAATASTKNWAAALGTLGLPLEQANQEIRSILQGDVNNPDSIIAKTLQISREQYDTWVANGVLIDELNKKLEVFAAGNALAAKSVAGITSNIQSFIEDTARLAGADLLAPIVESLNAIYSILDDNRTLIEDLAGDNVSELVGLFEVLKQTTQEVAEALDIDAEGFLKTGSDTISAIIKATEGLIVLGGGLAELFGPALSKAFGDTLGVINLSLEGIGKLATLLGKVTSSVANFANAVRDIMPDIGLDDALSELQANLAKTTGEYQDSIDAVTTYNDITNVLLSQTDKLTKAEKANADQLRGQIEQLKQQKEELSQVKTFRDQDAESIIKQKEALDKAILGLEEMASKTENLTFKAKELQDLGSIFEDLKNKATSAEATVQNQGAGDVKVFTEAVKTLTELTEKQVEYGQITIKEAKSRLEAILKNNKVELEAREQALNTLKSLEQDYTDFKIDLLDTEIEVLERRAQVGEITAIQSAEGQFKAENEQIKLQLDLLDQQIAMQEDLGQSTDKLLAERKNLINQSLQLEVDYVEKVSDLEQQKLDESYDKTINAAKSAELARTTALKQALLNRSVSQEEYNKASIQSTKTRLQQELKAEQSHISKLTSLLQSAGTVSQQKEIQAELDAARLKSQELNQQIVDSNIQLLRQQEDMAKQAAQAEIQAIEDRYTKTLSIAQKAEAELTNNLKQSLANREITQVEYNQRVQQAQTERLQSELKANQDQQAQLSELLKTSTDKESLEKRLNQIRQEAIDLESSLLDIELRGTEQNIEAIKKSFSEKSQLLSLEFEEKRAQINKTVTLEAQAQLKISELNVERIKKTIEAQKQAQAQLSALGDKEGTQDSKLKLRELAIDLVDAEIEAEKRLQGVIDSQLNILRTKLDLKRQTNDVDLLEGELKLNKAVSAGLITKEKAEKAKLELTKDRVTKEISLLQQLENQGTEKEQLENRKKLLKNQIQLEKVEQQIQEINKKSQQIDIDKLASTKGVTKEILMQKGGLSELEAQQKIIEQQLKRINLEYELGTLTLNEQVAEISHLSSLLDLHNQSNQRQVQLKQSQLDLITAQSDALNSGLGNELTLVNKSLQVRQKLDAITQKLAQTDQLSAEERVNLEKEATALREQLNVLGVNGAKDENELLEKRQVIQRQQLASEQLKLDLNKKLAVIETANQKALVEFDKIKAINKAKLLQLDAESLKIQAEKIRGEAALTEDATKRAILLKQANNIDAQVSRTLDLSQAQLQAAQTEADVRKRILDQQLEVQNIQFESQQKQLDTQETILESQQAYEASVNNLNPSFNNSGLKDYNKELAELKKELDNISETEIETNVDDTDTETLLEKLSEIQGQLLEPVKVEVDTKGVDKLSTKIDKVKENLKGLKSVTNFPPITVPLNVKPANLDVKVQKDPQLTSAIASLSSTMSNQTSAVTNIGKTTQAIKDRLSKLNPSSNQAAPVVKNNIVVKVDPTNNTPTVTVESLQKERTPKCS